MLEGGNRVKMFPIPIKYFDVNDVYEGGCETFWIMWKQLDDTDGKDVYAGGFLDHVGGIG